MIPIAHHEFCQITTCSKFCAMMPILLPRDNSGKPGSSPDPGCENPASRSKNYLIRPYVKFDESEWCYKSLTTTV